MGLLETILIIVILVVLVIVIWNVFFKKNTMLMNGIHQASPGVEISHTKLPENNSSNYSFALWFFIEDWNSNYGNVKNVIYMGPSKTTVAMTGSNLGASGNQGPALNPSGNNIAAALDAYENNLLIQPITLKYLTDITCGEEVSYSKDYNLDILTNVKKCEENGNNEVNVTFHPIINTGKFDNAEHLMEYVKFIITDEFVNQHNYKI